MKLHQLLALLPTIKSNASKAKTELYQSVQKTPLFKGLSRIYSPREEDGYVYPPESSVVQMNAIDALEQFAQASVELWDLAASQDKTNCSAVADITIEGKVILSKVPVTHLLFLEKQLTDLKTFIAALPVLDVDKTWEFDPNRGYYVTTPQTSVKTKKTTKPVVFYEATKEHPAQVKEVSEDVVEGTWTKIDISSCLSKEESRRYSRKVEDLLKAIITAREEANSIEVVKYSVAKPLFDFLLDRN